MLKFQCPNCKAELALGHMSVNPSHPIAPFYYWPRDVNGRALSPCERVNLIEVPQTVDLVMDSRGCWWRREAQDGSWSEIPAELVPPETFPLDDPHAPYAYRGTRDGAVQVAATRGALPDWCLDCTARDGRRWVRPSRRERWELYSSGGREML